MVSPWLALARVGVVLAAVLSVGIAWRLDDHDWGRRLRARFVMGVPWGTALVALGLLAVYLLVQGGLERWYAPLTIPFRAWSYRYPLGMVLSPFSHAGPGHLVGNLVGLLALAPLAEYAWGHYPADRGPGSGRSLAATPVVRVLAVPAAVVAVGLFVSLFSIGPVVGFSGVVFALAGFALVRYPLATVVAFSASGVFRQLYAAVRSPVVEASASPGFGPPWWATVAIQAHAIGLLVGVLVGAALFRRRNRTPPAGRLWLGTVVFAVGQSLWAVYWFRGNGEFVLFRALGVVLVLALAVLVAASMSASGRIPPARPLVGGLRRRTGAAVVVLLALAALSAPAVPVNLVATETVDARAATPAANGTPSVADDDLAVGGYTVTYAENITNEQVSVFDLSAFGETTAVNASGVVVTNDRRHLWTTAVRTSRLAFAGCATVRLGGLGWREVVRVVRAGWRVAGGDRAYTIRFERANGTTQLAYRSEPAVAEPVLAGRNVSVVPRRTGFAVVVSWANETLARVPVPPNGTTSRAANLTFARQGSRLFAATGGTRVRVATRETYQ